MSQELPPHHENPNTISREPLYFLDGEGTLLAPGTPAQTRPVGRPREQYTEDATIFAAIQFIDAPPAEMLPPGTKASPRPLGRERPTSAELREIESYYEQKGL